MFEREVERLDRQLHRPAEAFALCQAPPAWVAAALGLGQRLDQALPVWGIRATLKGCRSALARPYWATCGHRLSDRPRCRGEGRNLHPELVLDLEGKVGQQRQNARLVGMADGDRVIETVASAAEGVDIRNAF